MPSSDGLVIYAIHTRYVPLRYPGSGIRLYNCGRVVMARFVRFEELENRVKNIFSLDHLDRWPGERPRRRGRRKTIWWHVFVENVGVFHKDSGKIEFFSTASYRNRRGSRGQLVIRSIHLNVCGRV